MKKTGNSANNIVVLFIALLAAHISFSQEMKPDHQSLNLDTLSSSDTLFNTIIHDPYRGLENLDHPKVKKWYQQQNIEARKQIENYPHYEKLLTRFKQIYKEKAINVSFPLFTDHGIYYVKKELSPYGDALIYRASISGEDNILFTFNKEDNYSTIEYFSPSPSGKFVALGLSKNGAETSTLVVFDTANKKLLKDSIQHTLFDFARWLPNEKGFFYHQLQYTDERKFQSTRVRLHRLGENVKEDPLILSDHLDFIKPTDIPFLKLYASSEYVMAAVYPDVGDFKELYYTTLTDAISGTASWKPLASLQDKIIGYALYHDTVFVETTKTNSNGTLLSFPIDKSISHAKTIVDPDDKIIDDFVINREGLYILYIKDIYCTIDRYDLHTHQISTVPLPAPGYAQLNDFSYPSIGYTSQGIIFAYDTWIEDYAYYYYDYERQQTIPIDIYPSVKYETELDSKMVEVRSKDGILIPMTIIFSKGQALKDRPTILYGYGMYGMSETPIFRRYLLPWFEQGGIFAVAHVRGGGEKGQDWYDQGKYDQKANSWKDFNTCARFLIEKRYTSRGKLAAYGESGGGLMVSRAMTEAPSLFQAIGIQSGLLNPYRLEAKGNTVHVNELGSTKDSTGLSILKNNDPYLNIQRKDNYPPVFLSCGWYDNRVDIWHSGKFAARLQHQINPSPTLLYIYNGGHFNATDVEMLAKKQAALFAFFFKHLSINDI